MQTPPRVATRNALTMQPSPSKPPLKQIQGQIQIVEFIRPQPKSRTTADGHLASTPPLQRRRKINDDDDDDDNRPMVGNSTTTNGGTVQDPVVIAETENESDANFGVILLPQRQQTHDQSREGTRLRVPQSKRSKPSALDQIAEPVRPLNIHAALNSDTILYINTVYFEVIS